MARESGSVFTVLASLVFVLFLTELQAPRVAAAEAVDGVARFSACHNEHSFSRSDFDSYIRHMAADQEPVEQLFAWCVDDADCARAYHIHDRTPDDLAVFRFLASKWLPPTPDLAQPLVRAVCAAESIEHLVRLNWLLELRLQACTNSRVQCGNNERFIFSRETMEGHCVCIEDRNCEGGGNWRDSTVNYSTVSVVGVSVLLAILVAMNLWATCARLRVYQMIVFECQGKCGKAKEMLMKNL